MGGMGYSPLAMFSKSEMREEPSNGTCPVVSR